MIAALFENIDNDPSATAVGAGAAAAEATITEDCSDDGSVAESRLRSRMSDSGTERSHSGRKRRRVRRSSRSSADVASSEPRPFSPLGSAEERRGVVRSRVSDNNDNAAPNGGANAAIENNENVGEMLPPPPRVRDVSAAARQNPDDPAVSSSSETSFVRRYAVPVHELYDEDACVICEETVAYLHDREAAIRSESSGNAQVSASKQRAESLRALQARAQLAQVNQDKHKIIYDMEQNLRGQTADIFIRRKMLRLRRNLIERECERFGIRYVQWTDEMLRVHFDPDNGHVPQHEREAAQEHLALRRQFRLLTNSMEVRDPENPARDVPHLRVMEVLLRTKTKLDESRKTIREMRVQSASSDEAIRALTAAIARTDHDVTSEMITTDPETAAGTTIAGTDSRAMAANNDTERRGPNSAYSLQVSAW